MSDFAPFVAAALRDKSVVDLMEENQELRRQLQQHLSDFQKVEITGRDGTPVYYSSSMDIGKPRANNSLWSVAFSETEAIPLNEILNLEVRVGGDLRASFHSGTHRASSGSAFDFDYENTEPQMGAIRFHFRGDSCGVFMVFARVGPISLEDYSALATAHSGSIRGSDDVIEPLLDLHDKGLADELTIQDITFRKSGMSGTLGILQRQGVETEGEATPILTVVRWLAAQQDAGLPLPDKRVLRNILGEDYDTWVNEDGVIMYDVDRDEEIAAIDGS